MMDYATLKWIHILSSTLLFGTGIGSAFYMLATSMTKDVRAAASVTRFVVMADWMFTTPTVFIQPLSGFALIHLAGFPMTSRWLMWSYALYVFAIACWIPVVWLQIRMKKIASAAATAGEPLPPQYWRDLRAWVILGFLAFFPFLAIFWLMVAKPA
jgi:uncharacterized membrane protein